MVSFTNSEENDKNPEAAPTGLTLNLKDMHKPRVTSKFNRDRNCDNAR